MAREPIYRSKPRWWYDHGNLRNSRFPTNVRGPALQIQLPARQELPIKFPDRGPLPMPNKAWRVTPLEQIMYDAALHTYCAFEDFCEAAEARAANR